jgi:hypothetical protein
MRLSGAAIGPDAVLVWTGARELTRFERSGGRASFTLPVTPLASQIGPDGVRVVDERGTIHLYSHAGQPRNVVALAESPGVVKQAALSADGRWLALLTDEIQMFEHGVWQPWDFDERRAGYRELGVDLSANGRYVLSHYKTTATGSEVALGDESEGFVISERDGTRVYRHMQRELPPLDVALAPDGRWVAICADDVRIYVDEIESMRRVFQLEPLEHVQRFGFSDRLFGVLYDYRLVLRDIAAEREARLELPEQFEHLVLCDHDVVVVHPELGAWWIPLASVAFTAAAG